MNKLKSAFKKEKNPNGKRRYNIGYIIRNFYDINDDKVLNAMISSYRRLDFNLIFFAGKIQTSKINYFDKEGLGRKFDYHKLFDGLVLWPTRILYDLGLDETKINNLLENYKNIPTVTISIKNKYGSSIISDNRIGIEKAVEHLVNVHGRKKIAFIKGPEKHFPCIERYEGYKTALKKYGLPFNEKLISDHCQFNMDYGENAVISFLKEKKLIPGKDIDAIVIPNDLLAIGAINKLKDIGIKIPHEISITGYDNTNQGKGLFPSLTTIDTQFDLVGKYSIEILLDMLDDKATKKDIVLPTKLIVRDSCGCHYDYVNKAGKNYLMDFPDKNKINKRMLTTKERINKLNSIYVSFDNKWIDNLIANFNKDINNDTNRNFLYYLGQCIDNHLESGGDINEWHNVISEIRSMTLSSINDQNYIKRAENLFHQSRAYIASHQEKIIQTALNKYIFLSSTLPRLSQQLNLSLDFFGVLNKIHETLQSVKIPGYYFSLIDNKSNLKYSNLVLFYNSRDKLYIDKEGIKYQTSLILPDKVNLGKEKYCLCFFPIYHRDNKIGFIIYEFIPEFIFYYESISAAISSALDVSMLIDKIETAQKEKEKLLMTINTKNQKLKKAIDTAKKANNAKTRFLANVSHDIRTPLNAIVGFAEVVKKMINSEQAESFINIIIDESTRLIEIINQLLDISKIEVGKLKLIKEKFDFYQLMQSIKNLFENTTKTKGLEFSININNNVPNILKGDSLRLREILINLIGNSFKFTEKGSIQVSVILLRENNRKASLKFIIQDTGIGISEDKQKKIFQPFFQADDNNNKKYTGTGLGTTISKKFVELMNGKIGVISRENEGAIFWFTAVFDIVTDSIEIKSKPNNNEIPAIKKRNARILLAEDYPTNQKIVTFHLNEFGYEVVVVDNGKKAVDKFNNEKFDLILMDIQMPEMDGIEATKIIRSHPRGEKIPIIGFTANAFELEYKEYYKAGINDLIVKPFVKYDFLKKVFEWLDKGEN
ncbi:MAG: substrate-binding domain-containing protein [Spirochaetes bacterium]|nr:substrate-binding domain-containing protein [Spirochaetota bacterium]